jgi:hypothetical protein
MRPRVAVCFAVALLATLVVIVAQPLGSPWWLYADADASYTATGIDLAAGEHTFLLDHPGMPLEAVMAITVETRYLAHKLTDPHTTPHSYAAARLLNLDDSRIFFRGFAILFYVLGALGAFVILWRLMGDPLWGLAGALMWMSAPEMQIMSIQFRPDGLLIGLVLAVGFLIVRAAERRDAWLYTLAALLLGLTITVKIHAAGLVPAFAIALLWRPPAAEWWPAWRRDLGAWLRRYKVPLIAFAVVWLVFCAILDWNRVPFSATHNQRVACALLALAFLGYLGVVRLATWGPLRRFSRGPLRPVGAVLVTALAIGIVLPATIAINDLPEMLVKIVEGLTGGGINQGISPFKLPWNELTHGPLLQALVLFGVATVAAVVGIVRRDLTPLIWWSAAALSGAMALARLGTTHYFAPGYVLSIPPALWLAQRMPRRFVAGAGVALVLLTFGPVVRHLQVGRHRASFVERQSAYVLQLENQLVTQPGVVALAEDYDSPTPDVQEYVAWTPPYPYKLMSDSGVGLLTAEQRQMRPAYFIGGRPLYVHTKSVTLPFGTYDVQLLPRTFNRALGIGAMKLVHGPGVDRPLGYPDARYDPATGYYKDPTGAFWDIYGSSVTNPPKRRYLVRRHLWVDAYGDLWTATGRHAGTDRSLRTAK